MIRLHLNIVPHQEYVIKKIIQMAQFKILGILSKNKKILGMMPHPERFNNIKTKDVIMYRIIGSLLC